MNKTKINAEIVAHSLSPQGDELISVLCTFPRIILAEVNTHRMLSKNTSSSRAIPFKKMVEAVQNNPFIPIAWQKEHKGMQGSEYFNGFQAKMRDIDWEEARDNAVKQAKYLNKKGVTKQLCNRLLEPFMWTTMLITGSREGWDNFFNLRCPQYEWRGELYKSIKDIRKFVGEDTWTGMNYNYSMTEQWWRERNKGQAEIHIMDLAEKIYDAMNESTPKQLEAGEWHIPFGDKIKMTPEFVTSIYPKIETQEQENQYCQELAVKISTAMAAHTSYTIVGGEAVKSYEKWIELHDKLIAYDPPHSSPMEHCARAMDDKEYDTFVKGKITDRRGVYDFQNPYDYAREESIFNRKKVGGWCNNLKGFIPYRYFIDNKIEL